MSRRLANISSRQHHSSLLVQPNLVIARGLPFYLKELTECPLLWSLRSLQPDPSLRQLGQKGTKAAALAAHCTEANIPADLLHAHSCGLTHCSYCSLGVLLSLSSRQKTGLLPVISVSTYWESFHWVLYYLLQTFSYFITFLSLCFIWDIFLWVKLQFTDFLNNCT